jgi:hypothetical protein
MSKPILERWRCRWGEVDIIARKGRTLVFVEVKARATEDAGIGAIAPAHGLPRMGEIILRSVRGLVFEWDLGRAGMGNATRGTPRRVYARLVGVSPQAVDLGVTIPLEVARRLNREYAGDAAADTAPDTTSAEMKKAVEADVAKTRAEQCRKAQERYKNYVESYRVYRDKDGKREYLNSKELDEARLRARKDVDTYCSGK